MNVNLVKTTIGKNILANFFAVGINLLNQILLVPFFLIYWGNEKYSDWIILTAVSSFFSISDIGLNSVTSNSFSVAFVNKDYNKCNKLLTNNIILIVSISVLIISIILLSSLGVDIRELFGLHVVDNKVAYKVFIILVAKIFIGMLANSLSSIYRANSIAYRGVYFSNISRVIEILILLIAIISNIDFSILVILYVMPSVILLIFVSIDIKRYYDFHLHLSNFDKRMLKQLLIPSFSFLSFPLGNAIIMQGFSVLVNKFYGADVLVVFNTTRTLTNFVKSVTGNILSAIWPEFTIAYGKKDFSLMRKIHRKSLKSIIYLSIIIAGILCFSGKYIFSIWTKGVVEFDIKLMLSFLVVLLFNNVWNTSKVTLVATNNHEKLGFLYLLLAILVIFLASFLAYLNIEIYYIVYCVLICDLSLAYYTIKKSLILTKDSFYYKNI